MSGTEIAHVALLVYPMSGTEIAYAVRPELIVSWNKVGIMKRYETVSPFPSYRISPHVTAFRAK
eukprot:3075114-Rhodomonas_salina.1